MIPKRLVRQVLARDPECMIRGPHCLGLSSVADHRWGRGAGGNPRANALVNLVGACGLCNGDKESIPDLREACRARGLALETQYPPKDFEPLSRTRVTDWMLLILESTPIIDPSGTVWMLTPDGHRERLVTA